MSVILSFICSADSAMAARAAVYTVRSQSVEWKCVEGVNIPLVLSMSG